MAQQKNKSILTRLIAKVHSMLTQLNRNTTAIKVKAESDLSNVNVGTTHTRKLLFTNGLGGVTYVDYPTVDISGKLDVSAFNTEQTRVNNAIGAKADSGMVNTELDKKANKTLDNVDNADFAAKLQAAGVNTGIFNEFKGVLATAPAGTHNDLDWYINDTDNKLYLWHSNQWNSIGGGATATLDKAALLNLLGVTDAQLGKLLTLAGKTLTQSTLTFDDNATKTVFILE